MILLTENCNRFNQNIMSFSNFKYLIVFSLRPSLSISYLLYRKSYQHVCIAIYVHINDIPNVDLIMNTIFDGSHFDSRLS
jgi:hypothetical protein